VAKRWLLCAPPAVWPNHLRSYDFVMGRTHDGKGFRMLTIIDVCTRECLAIDVSRHIPNNYKGLYKRLDYLEANFCENFAKPPGYMA
jgi:hypothetical protein